MSKKILLFVFVLFAADVWAQAPEGINYQAVARDISGAEMPNTPVNVQVQILNSALAVIYQEDHTDTTNAFGLFNLVVGQGQNPTSTFANINWASGPFYLKISIDANSSGYVNMGYTQLWSVPYALYAKQSANGPQGLPGVNCWDTNGDGVNDPSEDRNGDSQWNAFDCQGDTGLIGPTGPQGAQGIQGTQGTQGIQGVAGTTGPQGPQGTTGIQGLQGVTGPQGVQGATGTQGIQGVTGTQGIQGVTGSVGSAGPTGLQGPQGIQGPTGAAGPTGSFSAVGTLGQTLYHDGTTWTPTSMLNHDGFYTGIGTASTTSARLTVGWSSGAANSSATYSTLSSSASGNNHGVYGGITGTGSGNYFALYGTANNSSGAGPVYGVWGVGYGLGTGARYGVYGGASIQAAGQIGYGVYGSATGNGGTKYGVYGDATGSGTNYAGWFEGGNVYMKNFVGIGTSTPGEELQVADVSTTTGAPTISILGGTSGTASLAFGSPTNSNYGQIRYDMPTHNMYFWTQNTYRFVIDGQGNVGIGTNFTTPMSLLHLHASGVTQMQMTNTNSGNGAGDGFTIGYDNASTAYFNNQESGGIKFRDGANVPLWISGTCVGINSPLQPLYSLVVYNNVGHLALEVGNDQTAIGDVNNMTAGNYLWIDHTAATAKFMFWGANTAFGTFNNPTAKVEIAGTSSTTGTYTLKVENATGTVQFATRDDGKTGIGSTSTLPTSTLDVSGSFAISNQLTVAANSTTALTPDQSVVFVSGTTASVTLPAASASKGRVIIIKQTAANISTTIATSGGNIEGSGSFTLGPTPSVRRSIVVTSDGSNWWIVSQY